MQVTAQTTLHAVMKENKICGMNMWRNSKEKKNTEVNKQRRRKTKKIYYEELSQ